MRTDMKLMWRDIGAICRDREWYENDVSDKNVTRYECDVMSKSCDVF